MVGGEVKETDGGVGWGGRSRRACKGRVKGLNCILIVIETTEGL